MENRSKKLNKAQLRLKKRSELLGESYNTCYNRLRKIIFLRLLSEAGYKNCYRCGFPLDESVESDHIIDWESSLTPKETFLDPNNIAFSHRICNVLERTKKQVNRTGYIGVTEVKGKYVARIRIPGKDKKSIGSYNTPIEAAEAYDRYAISLHGLKARTNKGEGRL